MIDAAVTLLFALYVYINSKYVWNKDLKGVFLNKLQDPSITNQLEQLNSDIGNCHSNGDIECCVSKFIGVLDEVSTPLFRKKIFNHIYYDNNNSSKENDQPWYTKECGEKQFYFYKMLKKFREVKSDENRVNMVKARSEYKSVLRKSRSEYDKKKTERFVNAKFKNAKLYWNLLKSSAGIKPANIPLSSFEQYFKAVNNPHDPFYTPDEDILFFNERYENNEFAIIFEELNEAFTQEEILKSINQLKSNKSAGPDKLINEFFMNGKAVLKQTITNLFNKIFEVGHFPESWSEGFVIPLHKKGSIHEVENYRGITLLSVLGKLFTRVINNRLGDWAENYFLLIEAQAGFRPGMGTVDNIFVLHGLITHMLNTGNNLYCAFIDFTKAFDYVVRENLWFKLITLGLRGKILNIIKSIYSNVRSRVKFCNKLGNEFTCSLGVRQGECLSPILFSLYLNDIEEQFRISDIGGIDIDMMKIFLLLYADDIVVFANTPDDLQTGLDILYDYCLKWKLTINVSKTKVMIFRKGGVLPGNLAFTYNGIPLEIVSQFKYLGIVFTPGGSFSEAQTTLAGQAQKAIFKLNKYLYKFTYITPKHKLELFDKLITPILNYSSAVWGFSHANVIERVHLQFCKKVLGVKKNAQNDFVYGELGRTTLITKRYYDIVKYWFKVLASPDHKYIHIIYNLMLHDIDQSPNKVNWASLLRDLLRSLGFNNVWLNQGVGNINAFLAVLKQRLTDNFVQNWFSRLEDSSRALCYRSIALFRFQPYLEIINIQKFCQAFSKLRMSSHRLEIEAGRWVRPIRIPIAQRKCSVCNVIEDEFHFVLECQLYNDLRKTYIPKYYWRRPSMSKFVELLNSENRRYIRKLGSFIHQVFKLRSDVLYNS